REIQRLKKEKPRTAEKLQAKYSRREKNRANQRLHEISKLIVMLLSLAGAMIVMEDLTNIRDKIKYRRRMNRRLHSWNYRRLQSYISYKAAFAGTISVYENPQDTSKRCPICGSLNNPNGRAYQCKICGLEADRQMVGGWNIAIRCGESPLPPKGIYEMKLDFKEMQIFDINECISKI
ncbi:MAG: transposase, partial [archaeon]|nr:transposase [archaeon]